MSCEVVRPELEQFIGKLSLVNKILSEKGLGIDIDNTEIDTAPEAVVEYNRRHPAYKRTTDEMTSYWSMVDWCKNIPYIKDGFKEADDIWHSKIVLLSAHLVDGAKELATYLESRVSKLHRITSRPTRVRNYTLESYKLRLPFVDPKTIHQTSKNEIDSEFKVDRSLKLKLGYFIEDSQEHAEKLAAKGIVVALVPQSWNKSYVPKDDRILTVTKYGNRPKLIRVYLTLAEYIVAQS